MNKYAHLTLENRKVIECLHKLGKTQTYIATRVGVDQSTISRELSRNGPGPFSDNYDGRTAHEGYMDRRFIPSSQGVLETCEELYNHLVNHLTARRSVTQALVLIRNAYQQLPCITAEAVYKWMFAKGKDPRRKRLRDLLVRPRSKRRKAAKQASKIADMVGIQDRPTAADERSEVGHWEGDLVVGKAGQSAVATLVDRKTRYALVIAVESKKSGDVVRAVQSRFKELPPDLRRTLTWDRGVEMTLFKYLEHQLDIKVFFADAYSPWQRGSNENFNGVLRRHLPKGADLGETTDEQLRRIESLLNTRPMPVLSWGSPEELFSQEREYALRG